MKKLLAVMLLLFVSTSLFAYKSSDALLYFGGGAGISGGEAKGISGSAMGSASGGNSSYFNNGQLKPRLAWGAGISGDYFFTDMLTLTYGLLYESKPVRVSYSKLAAPYDMNFDFNFKYLTVPLGLHCYIDAFYFGGGLYYSILIDDAAEIKYGSKTTKVTLEKTKDDVGLFFDAGLNFEITDESCIIIFARYNYGLTKIYAEDDIITDVKTKTLTLNAAVGVKF